MKASIIIPSYNACERLYLNLVSLKYQDCPHNNFEVIVIDNGSTDDTRIMLSNFEANFPLTTVYIDENRGIARGRNQGITKASGDILIFHDSDMIAPKDFIRRHINAHRQKDLVICGLPWLRIYSYFYKDFNPGQVSDFYLHTAKYNLKTDWQPKDKSQLVTEQQIINRQFLNLSFDLDSDFVASLKETLSTFGQDLKGYNLPWRFFITNNASVERKKVIDLGMFDENIVKYGFEDYDLGFRLYKAGCRFRLSHDILSVHQEHPKSIAPDDVKANINFICEKYNNVYHIDMVLLCLNLAVSLDQKIINGVISDINHLYDMPQYSLLLNTFLKLLQTVRKICYEQDITPEKSVIREMDMNFDTINHQLKELQEKHGMFYFPNMFWALRNSIPSGI